MQPKVSVVTPVYNGERYLDEAIESVRAQTCANWEHVIADNGSTDGTCGIAERYARRDPRIRVFRADSFLPIIANWNRALRQIAPDSRYCKVLHADDLLFPECLERMVDLMEANPRVALVSSYVLCGTEVECDGLPLGQSVWNGSEICRDTLLGCHYLFGSPSSVMMRSELVRARPQGFYNEDNVHADFEACYQTLEAADFGFVHQVLSFTRRHPHSVSSTGTRFLDSELVEYLGMLRNYGPKFLDGETFARLHRRTLRTYRRVVARRLLAGRGRKYWEFHRTKLHRLGYRVGPMDFALALVEEFARLAVRPGEAARLMRSFLTGAARGSRPSWADPRAGRPGAIGLLAETVKHPEN